MAERVKMWLQSLEWALQAQDVRAAAELFQEEECFWRDLVAFTWNYYTAESRADIEAMLDATLEHTKPSGWAIEGEVEESCEQGIPLAEAFIRFETERARGKGRVKLRGDKCWCLLTAMQELKGHEELAPPEIRKDEQLGRSKQPYCLIVGGGHCGIMLAARLGRLGVPTIVVDTNKCAGDSWRKRYRSLCLHSTVWMDHFPYLPFPENWPLFATKDELGDWLEAYIQAMDLVYWTSTECKTARFDEAQKRWIVKVEKEGKIEMILYPKQLVLCTSLHGLPSIPSFKGAHQFHGVQMHSSEFKGGDEWAGKNCVVIGAGNSAHDIAADLCESGVARVTMLQRSSTLVVPRDIIVDLYNALYNSKYSIAEADLLVASIPHKLCPKLQGPVYKQIGERCAGFYKGLKEAGFQHSFGEDGAGVYAMFMRRGSGYYIDVGASELVIKGDVVKVKSGVQVEQIKAHSLVLTDGSELPAELIVYATGYEGGMRGWAARLISQEVADKVGKCWGLGSSTLHDPGPWERELRNMYKPTRQQNLWFHAGGFIDSRIHSQFLALQLKARMAAIPTPLYGFPQVHHT